MEQLKELIMKGNAKETVERVRKLLEGGSDPGGLLQEVMIPAMDEVGDLFQKGEYFVPEMLVAARAMQQGLTVLKPRLVASGIEPIGKVIIGTVKGDLHDIGKNLAVMALEGAGFEVIDLGTDVAPERFIDAIKEHKPQVIGMSALLTTTMLAMKDTIKAIEDAGIRGQIKIMIGGAPIRQEFCDEVGADFFAPDSTAGRNYARNVVTGEA
ncbi:MAG: methyltransferase [Deltaproteobacteria bacterium RBG_13_61_14]|nr:MAG: methyltransferase [Deltaproteobacteria bacterium RBG_13_61_14]